MAGHYECPPFVRGLRRVCRPEHKKAVHTMATRCHPTLAQAESPLPAVVPLVLLLAQRHAGAKVVGEWSRFDVMTRPQEYARASIPALAAVLPVGARSLYYRDAIGNISSSGGPSGAPFPASVAAGQGRVGAVLGCSVTVVRGLSVGNPS